MDDRSAEFDATALIDDPAALRERADQDGFLFFRGLLPVDAVMALRREVLDLVAAEGLLDDSRPRMEGIANVEKAGSMPNFGISCGTRTLYPAVQKLASFHALAHHANLLAMFEVLFQEEVLVHPRHIMRLMFPMQGVAPTDPHQDIIYINGTPRSWTCWIPVGDCPMETGNLSVLRASHASGVLPVRQDAKGAGGMETLIEGVGHEWVTFDFQAGDVLTFPCLTVHKSIPTQHPERIRLSLDYRYQALSEPVHESSLKVHMGALAWEEVYREWTDNTYQYYWQDLDLNVVTDTVLGNQPELIRERRK